MANVILIERANRIHWIKNILLQSQDRRIKFFQFRDEENVLKDHYWFEEKDFIVVLKPVNIMRFHRFLCV